MSIIGQVINEVGRRLPDFNDTLLREYREKEINHSEKFIELVIKEAIKLFNNQVKYIGYRKCTPVERVKEELSTKNIITKGKNNIRLTHAKLVEYIFEFEGEEYTFKEYVPYSYRGFLVINNTEYAILLSVSEKVFTIIQNGIGSRVIRAPIRSYKHTVHKVDSLNSDNVYVDTIVTTKIYNRKPTKLKVQPTIIHYLLCKYGFRETLSIFDISDEEVCVTENIDENDTAYEYFNCKKMKKRDTTPPLYLKVKKDIMAKENAIKRRVVIHILFLLEYFDMHTLEDIYNEKAHIFKIMLGKLTHGMGTKEASALEYMNNHIASLETYLDPVTKARLSSMGIFVNNIYDLLIHVFNNISKFLMENKRNDLYNRRIDIVDNLFLETIVKTIYKRFYKNEGKELSTKSVATMVKIPRDVILKLTKKDNVQMSPARYNPNQLLYYYIKKVRASAGTNSKNKGTGLLYDKELLLSPSTALVESLLSFGSSNPGSSGHINPFLPIDPEDGSVVKPDWVEELEKIRKYLPYA